MSSNQESASTSFYVSNVTPVPDKITYTVVIDAEIGGTAKLVMGYVVERQGQDREYLNSQGGDAPSPRFRDELDAAVDHYKAWAAKH
jgi:hypothetical protein